MKKLIMIFSFLFATTLFSQEIKPKYEKVGTLIKVTYHYSNGEISQTGFFKDGKPHDEWISFDEYGKKMTKGKYNVGVKTGKWLFWDGSELSEVTYSKNEIAGVKIWNEKSTVVSTFRK